MTDAEPWTNRRRLHAVVWAFSLAMWTIKLLDPKPVPSSLMPEPWFAFILAKTLHVVGYFVCTLLGLWLWRGLSWRIVYAGFMVWHGIGTEVGQSYIPTRSGSPKDVGFDALGISLACGVTWWLHSRRNSLLRSK